MWLCLRVHVCVCTCARICVCMCVCKAQRCNCVLIHHLDPKSEKLTKEEVLSGVCEYKRSPAPARIVLPSINAAIDFLYSIILSRSNLHTETVFVLN